MIIYSVVKGHWLLEEIAIPITTKITKSPDHVYCRWCLSTLSTQWYINHHLAHISAKYHPCIEQVSSDIWPIYLLTVSGVSVEYRLSVGCLLAQGGTRDFKWQGWLKDIFVFEIFDSGIFLGTKIWPVFFG